MHCVSPPVQLCAGWSVQLQRTHARPSRTMGALPGSSTPAKAKAVRADQPIPTQTNGTLLGQLAGLDWTARIYLWWSRRFDPDSGRRCYRYAEDRSDWVYTSATSGYLVPLGLH